MHPGQAGDGAWTLPLCPEWSCLRLYCSGLAATMCLDIKPRAAVVNNTCSVSFLLHPPLLCHGHPALPAHSDLCQMA